MVGGATIAAYFREKVWSSFDRKTTFDQVHWWEDVERSAVILEWRSHVRPKTGKDYSNTGVFVVEIKDGRIYWVREYFDTEKAHKNVNP
jgi:ketosteroid isomerase-like protein